MIRVAVLRGGPGKEHAVSLQSGARVLETLSKDKYVPIDIYIDPAGVWHERGRPISRVRALQKCDVVFNALHGTYGEDGEVQKLFKTTGVPHTGSGTFPSFVATHKVFAKEEARKAGLRTPHFLFVEKESDLEEAAWKATRTLCQPLIIKPVRGGSSVGVSEVAGYIPLLSALQALQKECEDDILIEEKVSGREATVGILDDFRGNACYALPPVEIIPPQECRFFSYDAKYGGKSIEKCPGGFSPSEVASLTKAAILMHKTLGLSQYSRADFIVAPEGVYFLEINTQPGLTKESLYPKELAAAGLSFPDFLDHLIQGAMKNPSHFS